MLRINPNCTIRVYATRNSTADLPSGVDILTWDGVIPATIPHGHVSYLRIAIDDKGRDFDLAIDALMRFGAKIDQVSVDLHFQHAGSARYGLLQQHANEHRLYLGWKELKYDRYHPAFNDTFERECAYQFLFIDPEAGLPVI